MLVHYLQIFPKIWSKMPVRKRWDDIAKNTKFYLAQFLYAIEVILDSTLPLMNVFMNKSSALQWALRYHQS